MNRFLDQGRWADALAALFCIGAGVYLLSTQTVVGNSIFNVLAHGIGAYMIGKGIFVWRSTGIQERQANLLDTSLGLQATQHVRATAAE